MSKFWRPVGVFFVGLLKIEIKWTSNFSKCKTKSIPKKSWNRYGKVQAFKKKSMWFDEFFLPNKYSEFWRVFEFWPMHFFPGNCKSNSILHFHVFCMRKEEPGVWQKVAVASTVFFFLYLPTLVCWIDCSSTIIVALLSVTFPASSKKGGWQVTE